MGVNILGQTQHRGKRPAPLAISSPAVKTIVSTGFPIGQLDELLANGPKLSRSDSRAMSLIVHNLRAQSRISTRRELPSAV
jgi:hypothetical protein